MATTNEPRVRVFVDDQTTPIADQVLPTKLQLDTRKLGDGPHRLVIRAEDQSGHEGVEEVKFHVQNGPGIMVGGIHPGSTHRGTVNLTIDAFSADDPFDPRRAEARRTIPTWVWVLCLFIAGWVIYYVATEGPIPAQFKNTPTFGNIPAASAPATTPPASTP